jgi:hypothetical protein
MIFDGVYLMEREKPCEVSLCLMRKWSWGKTKRRLSAWEREIFPWYQLLHRNIKLDETAMDECLRHTSGQTYGQTNGQDT